MIRRRASRLTRSRTSVVERDCGDRSLRSGARIGADMRGKARELGVNTLVPSTLDDSRRPAVSVITMTLLGQLVTPPFCCYPRHAHPVIFPHPPGLCLVSRALTNGERPATPSSTVV